MSTVDADALLNLRATLRRSGTSSSSLSSHMLPVSGHGCDADDEVLLRPWVLVLLEPLGESSEGVTVSPDHRPDAVAMLALCMAGGEVGAVAAEEVLVVIVVRKGGGRRRYLPAFCVLVAAEGEKWTEPHELVRGRTAGGRDAL